MTEETPPPPDRPALTADDVEQVGRMLMPQFAQSTRGDLDRLREDIREMFSAHEVQDTQRFAAVDAALQGIDRRVRALEKVKAKALLAWGIFITVGSIVFHAGKDYVLTRWAGQR